MAKLPVTKGRSDETSASREWHPLATLQDQIDRLFEDFHSGWFRSPSFGSNFEAPAQRMTGWSVPATDVVEKEDAYEITAELPGMDEKDIDVSVANGVMTIKGEKKEEKEKKRKDYYLSERRFGSFQRSFRVPEGVDADKIDAAFQKGVLTVTMPKSAEAQKPEKKISVKSA